LTLVDDAVALTLLASAAFFVAVSFGLLLKYRQVSQKISASTDLGRDLWDALERRMRTQDERILDMMGRLEVVQSRALAPAAVQPTGPAAAPPPPRRSGGFESIQGVSSGVTEGILQVQQPESQQVSQVSPGSNVRITLDDTQLAAIRLLGGSPKNTRQLTDALGRSREHTARIMKELFDSGLVMRDDSAKPFVYQLSDEGRRYLSAS
jgi:CRP-like cAMP-binding protein